MMMTLGTFLFEIGSLPYQELSRRTDWRHGQSDRFGLRKASQFLGPGDDKITLTGALFPGTIGSFSSIETVRDMAGTGEAFTMLDGQGNVLGQWLIRSLDTRQSVFFVDGVARKADFTLELERTDG